MNYNNEITSLLIAKNIQITAIRILVLQFLVSYKKAISLSILENEFEFSDRSSLYRTLITFNEKGLIHKINDGSSSTKYALCDTSCEIENHLDLHPHFYCEKCKTTVCVNHVSIPKIQLEEFTVNSTDIIIRGICKDCNKVA